MAKFNTRAGITWSDEQAFDAQSIIDFYNQVKANRRADAAEARAGERLEMAKDEMARMRDKEQKLIGSQHLLNDAVMKFQGQSGWKDGVYSKGNLPNSNEITQEYLDRMDELGLAGNAAVVGPTLSNLASAQIEKDAQALKGKMMLWNEANKYKYKDWDPFTGSADLERDRKAYAKSIGADALYANIMDKFGETRAIELTGMEPKDFGEKGTFAQRNIGAGITGTGIVGGSAVGLWAGNKTLKAMGDSIARGEQLIVDKGKGKELIQKLEKQVSNLKASSGKLGKNEARKVEKFIKMIKSKGFVDPAAHTVLSKLMSNPIDNTSKIKTAESKLKKQVKAVSEIGEPTTTSRILKKMKRLAPFSAPLVGAGLDEAMGMEAPVAETAGTVIMGAAQKKPFLQFLGSKLPARVAPKALALAAADGPLPWGELLGLGLTGFEAIRLFNEWKNLAEK